MTLGKFSKLYQAYKNIFDEESTLKLNRKRYCDYEKETSINDVIPF
jgi:hypothetical protein